MIVIYGYFLTFLVLLLDVFAIFLPKLWGKTTISQSSQCPHLQLLTKLGFHLYASKTLSCFSWLQRIQLCSDLGLGLEKGTWAVTHVNDKIQFIGFYRQPYWLVSTINIANNWWSRNVLLTLCDTSLLFVAVCCLWVQGPALWTVLPAWLGVPRFMG